jgi:hypothetical protein
VETPGERHERVTRLCHESREAVARACAKFTEATANRHPADDGATVLTINEQLALSYLRRQLRCLDLALTELNHAEG